MYIKRFLSITKPFCINNVQKIDFNLIASSDLFISINCFENCS
jgi:hypothetical protein